MTQRVPIFDLDGTLLDSDEALVAPFLRAGVEREAIVFGEPLGDACDRLGVDFDAYLENYDVEMARPFDGVAEMIERLDRWAIATNKYGVGGKPEIARLGWDPEVVFFTEDFGYEPKDLELVLRALEIAPEQALFVGDTDGDRICARRAGVQFALAGWNPRVEPAPEDLVLRQPADLFRALG